MEEKSFCVESVAFPGWKQYNLKDKMADYVENLFYEGLWFFAVWLIFFEIQVYELQNLFLKI